MKATLLQKISAYSTLAGSFLLAHHANAQIIYKNPPRVTFLPDTSTLYNIDFNDDGYKELQLHIYLNNEQKRYGLSFFYHFATLSESGYCSSSLLNVFARPKGFYIPGSHLSPRVKETFIIEHILCDNIPSFDECFEGFWSGKRDHYVAVRFHPKENFTKFYYGWVRFSVLPDCKGVSVLDYAYNSIPNQGIYAGETSTFKDAEGKEHIVFVDEPVAEEKTECLSSINIYSADKRIFIQNNEHSEKLQVSIFNQFGQLIGTFQNAAANFSFDTHNLPSGIYIVRAEGKSIPVNRQVFVE